MSTEENKAAVRRVCEDAINTGSLSVVDASLAPTYVYHAPGTPDIQINIEDLIAEGDRVVHRWRFVGTHQGDLMGIPPTGKKVDVTGMVMSRFVAGKVVEDWEIFDQMRLLRQLGVVPTSGQAGG